MRITGTSTITSDVTSGMGAEEDVCRGTISMDGMLESVFVLCVVESTWMVVDGNECFNRNLNIQRSWAEWWLRF